MRFCGDVVFAFMYRSVKVIGEAMIRFRWSISVYYGFNIVSEFNTVLNEYCVIDHWRMFTTSLRY